MTTAPWIVIPARGGSTGVPRKNVRLLGGIPLIARTIQTALAANVAGCVVVTDDDEIAEIAEAYGAKVVREPKTTGKATLDQVMVRTIPDLIGFGATEDDILMTMQPTCPFISSKRINEAMAKFEAGAGSVITVVDDRHLGWFIDADGKPVPDYAARVNRQMLPAHFRESGAIIAARIKDVVALGTRVVEPIALIELGQDESLDIDTWADWAVAEHFASRRKIFMRTDAAKTLGMGHVYRTLALVQALARHDITIVLSADKPLGAQFFADYPFKVVQVADVIEFITLTANEKPDLVVLDQLDNSAELVSALKQHSKVATFEDLGPGAELADLLISDLYVNENVDASKQLTGVENSILAPNFESLPRQREFSDQVETVLVLFGGTDPSHLADKALRSLEAIKFGGRVIVVRGLGSDVLDAGDYSLQIEMMSNVKNIPSVMQQADLALSSAGRTITELGFMGVPTLCMAQNAKEMTHAHTTKENGVLMLGLGSAISVEDLATKLENAIANISLRKTLHESALHSTAERSNSKIVDRIMHKLGL